MSNFGLSKHVDPDAAVSELPGSIYLKLRDILNTNPPDKDWRALVRSVEDKYTLKPIYIEQWSVNTNGQAAGNLLTELSTQGMSIGELAEYLRKINIDTHSLELAPYESVKILDEPDEFVTGYEGRSVQMSVQATGNPLPRYQWFFCKNGDDDFEPLTGRIENKLQLDNLSIEDAGSYACQLHNCQDPDETKISRICLVSVKPDPEPKFKDLHPPSSEDIKNIIAGPLSPLNGTDNIITDQDYLAAQVIQSRLAGSCHPLDVRLWFVGLNEK